MNESGTKLPVTTIINLDLSKYIHNEKILVPMPRIS